MKIKGVIKNLNFLKNLKMVIVKICLGISLELLWTVWGQFPASDSSLFQLVVVSRSVGPHQCLVNVNYRILICCAFPFRSVSLFFVYFGFLYLQVSSVSNFHPDTRRRRWSLTQAHLLSCLVGREEYCKEISLACVGSAHSVWATLGLPQLTAVCAFWVYTARAPGCSAGHCPKWAQV